MWTIKQTEEFQDWFESSDKILQDDTVEHVEILRQFGPMLGRPQVDTLKGSSITNLKELRKKITKEVKSKNPKVVKKGRK